jgi:4-hydroxy-tetrahydrodipicolinate synthase
MRIERIIGIKDSSHDVAYLDEVLALAKQRPDWTVLVGAEGLLADAIAKGGHGGVCGGANLAPRLFVDLYDAAVAGDAARVASLRQRVSDLGRAYRLGPHLPDSIRGMKAALSLLGICNDRMAEPFTTATPAERQRIRQSLNELGLLR